MMFEIAGGIILGGIGLLLIAVLLSLIPTE